MQGFTYTQNTERLWLSIYNAVIKSGQFKAMLNTMNEIRPPAVAGLFYPDSKTELASQIWGLLADAEPGQSNPKAIVVPHAGIQYSGPVAAESYRAVAEPEKIQKVLLIGPSHRFPLTGIATSDSHYFSTPLGSVPLARHDMALIETLPEVMAIPEAHQQEHCLEVQLPFLQLMLKEFEMVPLVVGQTSPSLVAEVLGRLWGGEETLIVISTDLSHYLSYDDAKITDQETVNSILNLEPQINEKMACGCHGLNGFLTVAQHYGLEGTLLELKSSGDTFGKKDKVVGYGAIRFD